MTATRTNEIVVYDIAVCETDVDEILVDKMFVNEIVVDMSKKIVILRHRLLQDCCI